MIGPTDLLNEKQNFIVFAVLNCVYKLENTAVNYGLHFLSDNKKRLYKEILYKVIYLMRERGRP
jgi:predicted transcriptional regulator